MYLYGVMLRWQGQERDDFDLDYAEVLAPTEEEARKHQEVVKIMELGYEIFSVYLRPRTLEEWISVDARYEMCVGCKDWGSDLCVACFSSVNTLWGET